jgi:beta-lactam-binding protein with PASTA domain
MSLFSFLKSKVFFKNLIYIIGAFLGIVLITSLMLRMYTHHGKSYRVPDLKGLTVEQIAKEVKKNKLRFQVIDSLFIPEATPGTVISQQPKAGLKVKQNRLIYITISSLSPEKVKIPNIIDISLRDAQSMLAYSGLRVGRIEYRPSEFVNVVLYPTLNGKQIPKNSLVNKGAAINLVVGIGLSDERTIVPELIGRNLREAKEALEAVGLNIGALVFNDSILTETDSINAIIWKQNPENSTGTIEIGSSIDMWFINPSEEIQINTEDYN